MVNVINVKQDLDQSMKIQTAVNIKKNEIIFLKNVKKILIFQNV